MIAPAGTSPPMRAILPPSTTMIVLWRILASAVEHNRGLQNGGALLGNYRLRSEQRCNESQRLA